MCEIHFIDRSGESTIDITHGRTLIQSSRENVGRNTTVITSFGYSVGLYYWEVRMGGCLSGNTVIGVACTLNPNSFRNESDYRSGWGICQGSGDIWYCSDSYLYGSYAQEGDVIGVLLNLTDHECGKISFFVNRKYQGIAFQGKMICGILYPAVLLFYATTGAFFSPFRKVPKWVLEALDSAMESLPLAKDPIQCDTPKRKTSGL